MKKISILFLFLLAACTDFQESSERKEARQQEALSSQAINSVGLPAIVNFREKRDLKEIYELRDTAIRTFTYIADMNGGLHKLCDSIGYGIPYATQYTNPQRPALATETHEQGNITLPQADPNGLYSPASADGTWVKCLDPKGDMKTVYIEPRIIVSPFALQ